jgi:hypothetical protein
VAHQIEEMKRRFSKEDTDPFRGLDDDIEYVLEALRGDSEENGASS